MAQRPAANPTVTDEWVNVNDPRKIAPFPAVPGTETPLTFQSPRESTGELGPWMLKALPELGAAGLVAAGPPGWLPAVGLAALGGAAGEATRQLIQHGTSSPERPQTSTEAAERIGIEGGVQGGTQAAFGALSKAISAVLPSARRWYQSALKPPLGGRAGKKAGEIVETGIRERIVPSEAGLGRVEDVIDDINRQIMGGLQARATAGAQVDSRAVVDELQRVRDYYSQTATPQTHLKVIDDIERKFLENHVDPVFLKDPAFMKLTPEDQLVAMRSVAQPIPIEVAQTMKQHEGYLLRKSYGEMGTIEKESRKQLVYGLKKEIERLYPEIAGLNQRESKLIDLEGALDAFVRRRGNLQMSGIGTPVWMGAVGLMSKNPMAGIEAGLVRSAIEHPSVKARIAFALDRLRSNRALQIARKGINIPNVARATEIPFEPLSGSLPSVPGTKTMTPAELEGYAATYNIPLDEARAEAQRQGYTVRAK